MVKHEFNYECHRCAAPKTVEAVSQGRADVLMRRLYAWRSIMLGRWVCPKHPRLREAK